MPIFVAGGIATGKLIAHLVLMGAAGAQMGTRFVMAEECPAHQRFKDVFIKARAREAISTPQYSAKLPVVSVRALNNHAMEHFGDLQLAAARTSCAKAPSTGRTRSTRSRITGSVPAPAAVDGDVEDGSLMAGQSVGLIDEVRPVRVIVEGLVREAEETLAKLGQA